MHKLKKIANRIKRDEKGTSILEVVITTALFVAIGGTFVYAAIVIEGSRRQSVEVTENVLTQSGITNIFRDDVANSRAIKTDSLNQSMVIAKSDGQCITWALRLAENSEKQEVTRAIDLKLPTKIAQSVAGGYFSYDGKRATIDIALNSGETYSESAMSNIAGSDGGDCW